MNAYSYTYAGASQNAVLSQSGNGKTNQLAHGHADPRGVPEITSLQGGYSELFSPGVFEMG